MKKNRIMTAIIAGTALTVLSAGAVHAATAEEIIQNMAKATFQDLVADMEMKGDVTISMGEGMEMNILGSASGEVLMTRDPLGMQSTMNFEYSAMGSEGSGSTMQYVVTQDDGSIVSYQGASTVDADGSSEFSWQKMVLPSEVEEMYRKVLNNELTIDPASLPFTYELVDGLQEVNGIECYCLYTGLTAEDVLNIFEFATSMEGLNVEGLDEISAQLEGYLSLAQGMVLNMYMFVNPDTYQIVAFHVDMDGSDWSIIESFLGSMMGSLYGSSDGSESQMEFSLGIKELYIDCLYSYDQGVSIEIPQEALNAAEFNLEQEMSTLLNTSQDAA